MTANQIKLLLRVERATLKGKAFEAKTDSESNTLFVLARLGYLTSKSVPLSGLRYRSVPEALQQARLLGLLPERGKQAKSPAVHTRGPRT